MAKENELGFDIVKSTLIFRRTDAEAPILWPLDVKSPLIGKQAGIN